MRAVLASALRCARSEPVRERHRPEETLLYQLVEEHWPVFRARAEEEGGLPRFVARDFEEYLRCGLPEHGLCHLACASCGRSMVVAFSCKRRGFCPSCCARRMSDVAAHLVDEVLPEVPVRQWVCSLPWSVRTALAYDRELCADVLGAFVSALERSLRRRAKRQLGLASAKDALFGAITVVQRSDSALRVNPHFHTVALDGVYVRGVLAFHALGAPGPEDVHDVARWTHAGLLRALERRGRSLELPEDDALASEEPLLASVLAASASDVQVLGAAAGQRTVKLVRALCAVPAPRALGAEVGGVDVHAERAIDGRDRAQIERLCRYLARPPLALERLERHDERRVRYSFKRAWKDGTHAVVLEPLDLIARLAALVPPPRFHMLRYHGVLAGHSAARAEVVPERPERKGQLPLFGQGEAGHVDPPAEPSRHPWPWLLRRVFQIDVSTCASCGGPMRVVEIATDPADAARVLAELGLGPRPPPARTRPVDPRQTSFSFSG